MLLPRCTNGKICESNKEKLACKYNVSVHLDNQIVVWGSTGMTGKVHLSSVTRTVGAPRRVGLLYCCVEKVPSMKQ